MRRAAIALAIGTVLVLAGCGSSSKGSTSSSDSHSGAEQACQQLDTYMKTYDGYGNELTYLGDALVAKNIAQVQAMADAASTNSFPDLTRNFHQLLVEAKSDEGKIFNVVYAGDLDAVRNECISHGYVVRGPSN